MIGIYAIENISNGKQYIGQAVNIKRRITKHFCELRAGRHHCGYLQRSFIKHGEQSFTYKIIEVCPMGNLTECEQYWINFHQKDGIYNLALVAGGSCLGVVHSQESRDKTASALKGRKHSKESRKKQSEAQTGKKRGPRSPFSKETRAKMSVAHKGKRLSPEHKAKISSHLNGNTYTKGHCLTEDHKNKIRDGNRGKAVSLETRAKLSAATKRYWELQRTLNT